MGERDGNWFTEGSEYNPRAEIEAQLAEIRAAKADIGPGRKERRAAIKAAKRALKEEELKQRAFIESEEDRLRAIVTQELGLPPTKLLTDIAYSPLWWGVAGRVRLQEEAFGDVNHPESTLYVCFLAHSYTGSALSTRTEEDTDGLWSTEYPRIERFKATTAIGIELLHTTNEEGTSYVLSTTFGIVKPAEEREQVYRIEQRGGDTIRTGIHTDALTSVQTGLVKIGKRQAANNGAYLPVNIANTLATQAAQQVRDF
jgi:hypothetical protein